MVKNKKLVIAVFCGSKSGKKDIYRKKTQEISAILTKNSYQIIYGGGRTGLMGNLSKVVKKENLFPQDKVPSKIVKGCKILQLFFPLRDTYIEFITRGF